MKNLREHTNNGKYFAYVLDNLKGRTDESKCKRFAKEWNSYNRDGFATRRTSLQTAVADWLRGLPDCALFPYYYGQQLEDIATKCGAKISNGVNFDNTETWKAREWKLLDNYYNFVACYMIRACEHYNIELTR